MSYPKRGNTSLLDIQERQNEDNSKSAYSADETFILERGEAETPLNATFDTNQRRLSVGDVLSCSRRVC